MRRAIFLEKINEQLRSSLKRDILATRIELALPPPSPSLALPGEPPVPWTRWLESFQTYSDALGQHEVSDARKKAILIHCLGTEGRQIFWTLGPAEMYEDAVSLLGSHFAAPQSVILWQILFRRRRQQPGCDNVVADLLSRYTQYPAAPDSISQEPDLSQMMHTPLKAAVSFDELRLASEPDPVLPQLRTYIRTGWPTEVSAEVTPYHRVRDELSCWNEHCVARGAVTVVPSSLQARVLSMAHEGHLGIVHVKPRCRDLVWWPGIDRDIENLVRDCAACLMSRKMGQPAPPPLQPPVWPILGNISNWISVGNYMEFHTSSGSSLWCMISTLSGLRWSPLALSRHGYSLTF
ncbi:uncharacterized protein LOC125739739 isoform X3 [Brienomyrus brachyistius]|uniref:uncharacterized protein LOC125739739 isoform X3 n=1 Tax=Brienomyrus brachyistius TaxID=42636 RepID=UPI0020B44C02|nr:uncharacterized protein LOC125739739 isoform X3 [Brienomyrus brachyistius]